MYIYNTIGNTPLVKLQHLCKTAEIYVKVESKNPGGSIKDRPVLDFVEESLASKKLVPGDTIIAPTSGNTGLALALVARQKGLKVIIVMPESMSNERKVLMRAYGAELILTPANLGMSGAIAKATELAEQNYYYLINQFSCQNFITAHYKYTGPEILQASLQLSPPKELAAIVVGVGTGGTLMGLTKYLREHFPNLHSVAVEPAESAVLSGKPASPHLIQGIGAGFVPDLVDRNLISEVMPISSALAMDTARQLLQTEGISAGISAGANVAACLELAKRDEFRGTRIISIIPDAAERYLSTKLFEHLSL